MESNEQTEVTSKTQTHREQAYSSRVGRFRGVEDLSKKEKGLMDMDSSEVTGGRGWVEVEEDIRG